MKKTLREYQDWLKMVETDHAYNVKIRLWWIFWKTIPFQYPTKARAFFNKCAKDGREKAILYSNEI